MGKRKHHGDGFVSEQLALYCKSGLKAASDYHPDNVVTFFQGDCMELLAQIPDGAAKLVVTSPPYNIGKPYEKRSHAHTCCEQPRCGAGRLLQRSWRLSGATPAAIAASPNGRGAKKA